MNVSFLPDIKVILLFVYVLCGRKILSSINGVVIPGGNATLAPDFPYYDAASMIYDIALQVINRIISVYSRSCTTIWEMRSTTESFLARGIECLRDWFFFDLWLREFVVQFSSYRAQAQFHPRECSDEEWHGEKPESVSYQTIQAVFLRKTRFSKFARFPDQPARKLLSRLRRVLRIRIFRAVRVQKRELSKTMSDRLRNTSSSFHFAAARYHPILSTTSGSILHASIHEFYRKLAYVSVQICQHLYRYRKYLCTGIV